MGDVAILLESFLNMDVETWAMRSGRIVLILVAAIVVAWILRRLIRRSVTKWAERQEARRDRKQTASDEQCGSFGARIGLALPGWERQERAAQRARTLGTTLASLASVVIYVVAVMLVLGELDVNLGPILAGAGVAGIALGFGAQSLVRDFLAGIFIVFEDQYGVGDIVDAGEATGVVEEVTLRTTTLRGLDGTVWHVPNGEIRRSGNKSQYWARVILDVPVAYGADVKAASTLIKRVADDVWRRHEGSEVLEEPELWGVEDFGPDSIALRLAVKTSPGSQWAVARELRAYVKDAMDEAGLEIPFPQRTVWLRHEDEKDMIDAAPSARDPVS